MCHHTGVSCPHMSSLHQVTPVMMTSLSSMFALGEKQLLEFIVALFTVCLIIRVISIDTVPAVSSVSAQFQFTDTTRPLFIH